LPIQPAKKLNLAGRIGKESHNLHHPERKKLNLADRIGKPLL